MLLLLVFFGITLLLLAYIVLWIFFRLCSYHGCHAACLTVLGSGGHTAEALRVLSAINTHHVFPLAAAIAITDKMSLTKLKQWQAAVDADPAAVRVYDVPRAREVAQSFATSIATTLWAIGSAIYVVACTSPSLVCYFSFMAVRVMMVQVLVNGPGSCVPFALIAAFYKAIGLLDTHIVYVESVCRVETLSLSARILQYLVLLC